MDPNGVLEIKIENKVVLKLRRQVKC